MSSERGPGSRSQSALYLDVAHALPPAVPTPTARKGVRRLCGTLLTIGVLEFVLSMAVEELFLPGYSLQNDVISDLGVGPHALVFNASIILLGLLIIGAAGLLPRALSGKGLTGIGIALLALAALGAIGVGLFPEDTSALGGHAHTLFALVTFLTGNLSMFFLGPSIQGVLRARGLAILGYIGGTVGLAALVLYASGNDLALGPGGMERLIVAPLLLWGLILGVTFLRASDGDRLTPWAPAGTPPSSM